MKYRVYLKEEIATSVDVEANDEIAAEEEALLKGLPGVMFLDHRYPYEGGWEVDGVEEIAEVGSDV